MKPDKNDTTTKNKVFYQFVVQPHCVHSQSSLSVHIVFILVYNNNVVHNNLYRQFKINVVSGGLEKYITRNEPAAVPTHPQ